MLLIATGSYLFPMRYCVGKETRFLTFCADADELMLTP